MSNDVLDLLRDRNPVPVHPPAPPIEAVLERRARFEHGRSATSNGDAPEPAATRSSSGPFASAWAFPAGLALSIALVVVVGLVVLAGHNHPRARNAPGSARHSAPHGAGDPASYVLLGQNVFYPYGPAVSSPLRALLDAATATAAKEHFPIKVALIASPGDLGTVRQLFGRPQFYARFLDQEISLSYRRALLVVMKNGYGVRGLPAPAMRTAATLAIPAGGTSDDLAQAALLAVTKLAAAAGHPLQHIGTPSPTPTSPGQATHVETIQLSPAGTNTAASGTVDEVVRNGHFGIVIRATGLARNSRRDAYAVWLYTSPSTSKLLGFVSPRVGANGQLRTAGALPQDASKYDEILVTLETNPSPRAPGHIILAARARFG